MFDPMLRNVRNTVEKYGMIRQGDRVVAAVSGGPDSVCLVHVLWALKDELDMDLVMAHFDHGLRPGEDEEETRFVRGLASSLKTHLLEGRASRELLDGPGSLEERSRHARYAFLDEAKRKASAQKIALGHHLDDQAETVLMRLLRGSGPLGLAGGPPPRDQGIIRPLIEVSRSQILAYLEDKGAPFMQDSSNLQKNYLRNRIRLEILPALESIQPNIAAILSQTAGIMRADEAWLDSCAGDWLRAYSGRPEHEHIQIPVSSFSSLPDALKPRVIRRIFATLTGSLRGMGTRHLKAVAELSSGLRPQGEIHLPRGVLVKRIYNQLVFSEVNGEKSPDFCYTMQGPGTLDMPALGKRLVVEEDEPSNGALREDSSPSTACLDGDKVTYPLTVRNFRPGDRFIPLGMKGRKKVKDFFIDLKIPSNERDRVPIITSGDKIVWICGLRIDEQFRTTRNTENLLRIQYLDVQ